MRPTLPVVIPVLLTTLLLGCGSSNDESNRSGTGADAGANARADAEADAPPQDASLESNADAFEDARPDAADAAPFDVTIEAQSDVSTETLPDAFEASSGDAETETDVSPEASGPRWIATIETSKGTIVVELNPNAAPITVDNFQKYANAQYYDGLIFHRVIPGFMIQGGGLEPGMIPRATLYPPIVNEAGTSGLSNLRGTIAMARTSVPDSATSQFFINTADNAFLDSGYGEAGYAVFGQVVDGMDVVDTIESVPTGSVGSYDDVPLEDVLIDSIVVTQE